MVAPVSAQHATSTSPTPEPTDRRPGFDGLITVWDVVDVAVRLWDLSDDPIRRIALDRMDTSSITASPEEPRD